MSDLFSTTAGGYGNTVRVCEETRGGTLVAKWTAEGGGYKRYNLGFTVRDTPDEDPDPDAVALAEQKAEAAAKARAQNARPTQTLAPDEPATVGELFDAYRDRALHMTHDGLDRRSPERQERIRRHLSGLERYLGRRLKVRDLTSGRWKGWAFGRIEGEIDAEGRPTDAEGVSPATAGKALATLKMVTRWGHREGLIERDPVRDETVPTNDQAGQSRPYYGDGEYRALLEAAPRVTRYDERAPAYELIVLAGETGRRISSILHLRWSDWLPEQGRHGRIRWRAEYDKVDQEQVIPVTERVARTLRRYRLRVPNKSPWLFPSPRDPERPLSTHTAERYLQWTEEKAEGVEHVDGRGFHGFRRRWVTKRKHLARSDVARAGGWKDPGTLDRYEQPDTETTESVVLDPGRDLPRQDTG